MVFVDFNNNQMAIETDAYVIKVPNFPILKPKYTKYGILVSVVLPNVLCSGAMFKPATVDEQVNGQNSYMIRDDHVVIIRHLYNSDSPKLIANAFIHENEGHPMFLTDDSAWDAITALFQCDLLDRNEDGEHVFFERYLNKHIKADLFNLLDAYDYRALGNARNLTKRYNLQEELKKCNDGSPLEPMDQFYHDLHVLWAKVIKRRETNEKLSKENTSLSLNLY